MGPANDSKLDEANRRAMAWQIAAHDAMTLRRGLEEEISTLRTQLAEARAAVERLRAPLVELGAARVEQSREGISINEKRAADNRYFAAVANVHRLADTLATEARRG